LFWITVSIYPLYSTNAIDLYGFTGKSALLLFFVWQSYDLIKNSLSVVLQTKEMFSNQWAVKQANSL
jgi:uncharacterized protein Usg